MPDSLDLSCSESMMSQFCRWPTEQFEGREGMAVEEAALGLASSWYRSPRASCRAQRDSFSQRGVSPFRLLRSLSKEQSVSQDFGEPTKGSFLFQVSDAAEQVKGGSLPKDGTGSGQGTSRGLELLQLRQDEPSHARGKHTLVLCRLQGSHVELQLLPIRREREREDVALQEDVGGSRPGKTAARGFHERATARGWRGDEGDGSP